MKLLTTFIVRRYKLLLIVGLVGALIFTSLSGEKVVPQYSIIEPVSVGDVSNGITAQGKISSAQKIDLNVYKQAYRLDTINIQNGLTVDTDDVLFGYDKNDIDTYIRVAQLQVEAALLARTEAELTHGQNNYAIATQENSLAEIQSELAQVEAEKAEARRTFYSTNLELKPSKDTSDGQITRTVPTISGQYNDEPVGEYVIKVYRSGASSGYSYTLNGLENQTNSVYLGTTQKLGSSGLEITFPTDIKSGDEWTLKVPNTDAPAYTATKKVYDDTIRVLAEQTTQNTTNESEANQQLSASQRNDTAAYRSLALDQAQLAVDQAYEALQTARRDVSERTILAPFRGTINGMRNVVAGTKVRTDDDTVQLGTLLSDTFLVTFSLRITDVTRITIGDVAAVSISALPGQETLTATISEISVLPDENNTYEIRATLQTSTSTQQQLREGILADVSIAQEQLTDVVRIPKAALRYENGQPYIQRVIDLPETARQDIEDNGSADFTQFDLVTEKRFIDIGLVGGRFVAVESGVEENDYLLTTVQTDGSSLVDPFAQIEE
jgi:multidrug resistance efflux pump